MEKRFNGLAHWISYFREASCAIVLLLVSVQPAFSATKLDGTLEITDGKKTIHEYAGVDALYEQRSRPSLIRAGVFSVSVQPGIERNWKGQLDGVEFTL